MNQLSQLLAQPMMIEPLALSVFQEEAKQTKATSDKPPSAAVATYAADGRPLRNQRDDMQQRERSQLAVVSLRGLMTRYGYVGWSSSAPGTIDVGRQLRRLDLDSAVGTIVIHVDSPGGTVTGTPEFASLICQIRQRAQTKVVAVADSMMASAAYYAASAAERIIATRSATVGSIGVIMSYADSSRMYDRLGVDVSVIRIPSKKARFSGVEPLSDEMRSDSEKRIAQHYEEFVSAVASHRGITAEHVQKRFGGGDTLTAQEAKDVGMIDDIASIDDVIAEEIRELQN